MGRMKEEDERKIRGGMIRSVYQRRKWSRDPKARTYHLFPQDSDLLVKLVLLGIICGLIGPGHLVPVTSSFGRAGYGAVLFGTSPDGFRAEGSGWGRHF